mgnify:CR=1 FL=1
MSASTLIRENRVRKLAASRGYRVEVSREPLQRDNEGRFRLIESDRNMVVLGERFDASLDDIEAYLTKEDNWIPVAEARNFIEQLRTRHNAQDIQLLDEDGANLEAWRAVVSRHCVVALPRPPPQEALLTSWGMCLHAIYVQPKKLSPPLPANVYPWVMRHRETTKSEPPPLRRCRRRGLG